jgi:hypothetical protein
MTMSCYAPRFVLLFTSESGLGRVKTPSEGALIWPLLREKRRSFGYVLIAAISGWMPMMFMTRVRL